MTDTEINETINKFKNEYKEKIKENAYFEKGFLFALTEIQNRLIKSFETKEV
jgi:hypothetical protein